MPANIIVKTLKEKWYIEFIGDMDISDIYIEQFLWHVFSYERLNCIKGQGAGEKFSYTDKETVYIFFQD